MQNTTDGSSRPVVFCKKGVLRNFTKFTRKHLYQSLFFNKVAGLRPAASLKKIPWHRCFPMNFVKFSRTTFSHRTHLVAASELRQSIQERTNQNLCKTAFKKFEVIATSYRRFIDVETTSCVYWELFYFWTSILIWITLLQLHFHKGKEAKVSNAEINSFLETGWPEKFQWTHPMLIMKNSRLPFFRKSKISIRLQLNL